MRHYLLRVLFFILFASLLGLISEAGFTIRNGKVFIVGSFTTKFNNITPDLVSSKRFAYLQKQNRIAIAQAELVGSNNKKSKFVVKRIYNVKTDKNGCFIIRNVSDKYTYFLVGAEINEKMSVTIDSMVMVKKTATSGKVLNMGHALLNISANNMNCKNIELSLTEKIDNISFMNYFISKSKIYALCHKIIDNSYAWSGKTSLAIVSNDEVALSGLNIAQWVKINS